MSDKKPISYKDSGVDITAGNNLVDAIKPMAKSTRRAGADSALGGFGGLFDLKAAGYTDPILVSATDGVGTKLKVAHTARKHDTVGIDLVAMCVNDLIVQGAEPLFFLDYFATGKLQVEEAALVVQGIANGCKESNCALIGGETAEMPGMYGAGEYDLAGFAVGAAERGSLLPLPTMKAGDVLLGLESSGLHSNGFSLVRKVVEARGVDMQGPCPFPSEKRTLADELLTPTKLYVRSCLAAVKLGLIKAMSHITGGGFIENIPRVLPDNLGVELDCSAWQLPPVFKWLAKEGPLARDEMCRTFNCGIGMVVVVNASDVDQTMAILKENGEVVHQIGAVTEFTEGTTRVVIKNMEEW